MSTFDNIATGGVNWSFGVPYDPSACPNRSFALEDYSAEKVQLKGVEVKEISAEEFVSVETQGCAEDTISTTSPKIRDSFEMSEYDCQQFISNLFASYGQKLYQVDYPCYFDGLANQLGGKQMCTAVLQKGFTEDSIARIAAEVGKAIDSRYKSGSFTDKEYEELNAEIENCTKAWVDTLYDCKADIRLEEERIANLNKYGIAYKRKMTIEEHYLEHIRMKQKIMKEDPPDFDALFARINQLRVSGINKKETPQTAAE